MARAPLRHHTLKKKKKNQKRKRKPGQLKTYPNIIDPFSSPRGKEKEGCMESPRPT